MKQLAATAPQPRASRPSQLSLLKVDRPPVSAEQVAVVDSLLRRIGPDPYAAKSAAIIRAAYEGIEIPAICRVLGVKRTKVWRVLRRLHDGGRVNGPVNALVRRKSTGRPSKAPEVIEYLSRGFSFDEAASRFQLHVSSVRRIARKAGIRRRRGRVA